MDHFTPEDFLARHGTVERFTSNFADDQSPAPGKSRSHRKRSGEAEPDVATIEPKLITPSSLHGKPIPPMTWVVDQWAPIGDVTLLYGDGGVGKTLLAQQLMASAAIGAPWCTLPVQQCKSLGLFCEDDEDELHRRQDAIQRHLGTDFGDARMDSMAWWCRKGENNLLCTFSRENEIQLTDLYHALTKAALDWRARLVVVDTAADVFGGNENDRGQVRQFIGSLSKLAMAITGAVVLCAHPSRTGMAAGGSMDSGSTGWSNSARSRLSLERPRADGDEPAKTDERVLTKRKANRSSIGETIKLRWQDGVIAPAAGGSGFAASASADRAASDAAFLALLERCADQGIVVSHSKNAANFAPKVFGKRPDRSGCNSRELEDAMHRLFAEKLIRVETYRDRFRNSRERIALVKESHEGGQEP